MAIKKDPPSSVSDPALDAILEPAPDAVQDVPSSPFETSNSAGESHAKFEPDAFLAGKKPVADRSETIKPTPPQIVKRGGVGFVTALLMSTVAAGAGAYLALLAGSRPDLLQKAGIAAYVPAPAATPSLGTSGGNLEPLTARISAVEAELLVLKTRLDGGTAPNPQAPQTAPAQPTGPAAGPNPAPSPAGVPIITPPAAVALAPADNGALKAELQGIAGRVTAIETRLAALDPTGAGGAIVAGLQADIAGLKAIIATLQQQASSAPSPAVTFAVVNLAEAANRAGPFMIEYETVRAAMPGVSEVLALEPYARTGIPTRQLLQERFVALTTAEAAQAAEVAKASQETGIVAWFRSIFADMVKVQPAQTTASIGTGSSAVLTRAKVKLDQGDLSGAVDEIATIPTPSPLVTEWTGSARKRLELESRISAVRGAVGRGPVAAVAAAPAAIVPPSLTPLSAPLSAQPAPLPATKLPPTTAQGTNP